LQGAQILVSSRNYACGSARPGAIFAHRDFGIRILISESFGPVFPTVCYKFGVLPIELSGRDMAALLSYLEAEPLTMLEVNIQQQRIQLANSAVLEFALDEHVRTIALSGGDELGLTKSHAAEIERFEMARRHALPWLFDTTTKQRADL
jgi:3-isopropylmalate/(R)-2-methylmalate dehydratase small subunit